MSAFCFYGVDIDSYAFRDYPRLTESQRIHQEIVPVLTGASRHGVLRCEECGELLNKWNESLAGVKVKRRKYDVGTTYDGVSVVSQRFRAAYELGKLSGLLFVELPSDPDFLAIRATRSVEFDAERRKTRFKNRCAVCGSYESVTGATPVYLKPGTTIEPREFVRTDLEFGSSDEKSPLILCGEIAAAVLSKAQLRGFDAFPIDDPSIVHGHP